MHQRQLAGWHLPLLQSIACLVAATLSTTAVAFDIDVPGAKARFELQRQIVADKLQRALLPAMRNHDIDMWIVLDRENNSDPLHAEIGGGFSGVRAAFVFFDNGSDTVEKIYVGSHSQPANSVIEQVYDEKTYYGYSADGLTPHLRKIVVERNPQTIGVNTSKTLPEADGLTVGLRNFLIDTIGSEYQRRIVSAELLVRDFRLNRTPLETAAYTQLLEWSAAWMRTALSNAVIKPGDTTAEDIAWWLEDQALALGMTSMATTRIVRSGEALPVHDPDIAVQPGDIINIDGGLHYLGFAVDIKRTAYVLRRGETSLPEGLLAAWRDAQRMGGLYASKMKPGAIGHEIWAAINADAAEQGYKAVGPDTGGTGEESLRPEIGVYGHSVGNVPHDIGTRVAADLPFAYGDRVRFPLQVNEWVSIELHVNSPIQEWDNRTWYARFEETAQMTPDGIRWMIDNQRDVFLIEPNSD
ncbi:MAG: aminopeptidase P family protein [Gammaproteobacteria bacterium]|nr:aminopeptidase P family protein [Gammaproteobacteria bacterium]